MRLESKVLKIFAAVAEAMFTSDAISVAGSRFLVGKTGGFRSGGVPLKRVPMNLDGTQFTAIQQNPNTGSRWAAMARRGHRVVQFKDSKGYVAVAVDGKVEEY